MVLLDGKIYRENLAKSFSSAGKSLQLFVVLNAFSVHFLQQFSPILPLRVPSLHYLIRKFSLLTADRHSQHDFLQLFHLLGIAGLAVPILAPIHRFIFALGKIRFALVDWTGSLKIGLSMLRLLCILGPLYKFGGRFERNLRLLLGEMKGRGRWGDVWLEGTFL